MRKSRVVSSTLIEMCTKRKKKKKNKKLPSVCVSDSSFQVTIVCIVV